MLTIWRGTALSGCQLFENEIRLRHSQYMNSQVTGECIDGTVVRSVRVSGNCYTSQLSLAVEEEMVNETIECIHGDLYGVTTIVGQKVLHLTLDGK